MRGKIGGLDQNRETGWGGHLNDQWAHFEGFHLSKVKGENKTGTRVQSGNTLWFKTKVLIDTPCKFREGSGGSQQSVPFSLSLKLAVSYRSTDYQSTISLDIWRYLFNTSKPREFSCLGVSAVKTGDDRMPNIIHNAGDSFLLWV